MDVFKLLTRSTNIQKSTQVSKIANGHQVPSSGVPDHSELNLCIENRPQVHEKAAARGVKRKRNGAVKDYASETLERQKNSVLQDGLPAIIGATSRGDQTFDHDAQSASNSAPVLSEEDSRQILKRHKLKVTILEDSNGLGNEATSGARSSNTPKAKGKKDAHTQLWPQPLTSFGSLRSKYGISRRLAENLDTQGYKQPTEVQMGSLPLLLGSDEDRGLVKKSAQRSGKHSKVEVDLLTIAPTGSGKTLGFMIPVINGLLADRQAQKKVHPHGKPEHQVQALIVAPTHELADQIVNEGRKLALGTGIRVSGLRKGMKLQPEATNDKHQDLADHLEDTNSEQEGEHSSKKDPIVKADILISTPLMFLHAVSHNESDQNSLPSIRFLILDEADVLLDPLFREQTLGIWQACTNPFLRTSLWSATIGSSIETLAHSFIEDRRRKLGLKSKHHRLIRLVVGLKDSAIPNITHRLVYAASEQGKLLALRQLVHPSTTPTKDMPALQPPFLIFTQNIPRAVALHAELLYDIPHEAGGSSRIAVLHSDLSDTARSNVMTGFRRGEIWILITTDLLSRGVDFRGMNGVVNYDIPNTGASYVHRVGRTGRQGREGGVAVTLYTKEDIPYVKNVANVIAASERANGSTSNGNQGVQKWLLDALPNVSKKAKKELKSKGVASRRVTVGDEKGKEGRRMRISTKSGYDRRLENKRKGAVRGSQRRRKQEGNADVGAEDNEWGGFDD